MYTLYLYDEIVDTFETERAAYDYIRYNAPDLIEEEHELNPDLVDATDEYIISLLLNPETDGFGLVAQ